MTWETVAAFLTGAGSIIGSVLALKAVVRRCDKECEQRMNAFREGLDRK